MKKIILILFAVCITSLYAQESKQTYGIYGGFNNNLHIANFQKIPDVPNCCPQFVSGYGTGLNLGILFEQKLNPNFNLGIRLGYDNYSAELTDYEPTKVIVANTLIDGEFEHIINSTIAHYQFSVDIAYYLFRDLRLSGGVFGGIYSTADYSQYEQISKPDKTATFADASGKDTERRIRNEFEGSLKDVSPLSFGLLFGVSYELPLNQKKSFKLTPEISYQYFLNDIAENLDWSISSLKAGVALKYTPTKLEKVYENIEQIDTIEIRSKNIFAAKYISGKASIIKDVKSIDDKQIFTETLKRTDTLYIPIPAEITAIVNPVGLDANSKEKAQSQYIMQQYIYNKQQPLLNYVFFDSMSYHIPAKYSKLNRNEKNKFSINNYKESGTIETYYQILNVIAQRMQNNKGKLTLIGCNSNIGGEKDNLKLSERRAIELKKYFVDVWEIDSTRIKIQSRNLPQKYSSPAEEHDKIEENRRVELYSDNAKIIEPIIIEDTLIKTNPPMLRFYIESKSDLPIKKWDLSISNKNSLANSTINLQENGNPPKFVDIDMNQNANIFNKKNNELVYNFTINDVRENIFKIKDKPLYIETLTIDDQMRNKQNPIEINKFNLILFDFNSAKLNKEQIEIFDFVNSKITGNSKIYIYGYTDRTGDDIQNKTLSLERAEATKKFVKSEKTNIKGIGEDQLLYDNNIPEGRFYSRTVEIIVETPLEVK